MVDHYGFSVRRQQTLFLEDLEYPTGHLPRAPNQATQFLTADLDLHSVRMGHRVGLVAQIHDGMRHAPGDVEEKLNPWMQPVFDNLEYIFTTGRRRMEGRDYSELLASGIIHVEPLTLASVAGMTPVTVRAQRAALPTHSPNPKQFRISPTSRPPRRSTRIV